MVKRQTLSLDRGAGGGEPTQVWTGEGALEAYARRDEEWLAGRSLFVITDRRVARLHGSVLEPLRRRAAEARVYHVPAGEAGKELSEAERLWRRLLRDGARRDSCLVAFGGGSIGDLGGFVASTLFRGVVFLQLPTTLLAQVDAALGGKTAIDLPEAKNCVGTFHQPRAVIAESAALATLPRREMISGLAEVIKMGATLDHTLFERVERNLERLVAGDRDSLAPLIVAAQKVKIDVVEADPREEDSRRALNFGHTLGHAIEAVLGYKGLRHGEAVAYGMLFALRLARRRGLDREVEGRIASLIRRLPLPPLPQMSASRLLSVMGRDKKASRAGLVWILP
ncbi:MAG TPA: 3-dehydroquinate synthase, partial [Thermoanaerobaculia bacterium]|nr:3-dehydroquinate synthase [Thermoanaerobaculia bacterium]